MEEISNPKKEKKIFKNRLIVAVIIMSILSLVLLFRMYDLQIINYDYYQEESLGNQLQNLPITPIRGNIFDRNGKVIATNRISYRIVIIPEKVKNITASMIELKKLGLINNKDIEKFKNTAKNLKEFQSIPIKNNLSEEEVAIFSTKTRIQGIDIETYFRRIYPNGDSSVHLIGYVALMNKEDINQYDKENYQSTKFVGKTGIEKQYEDILHGISGTKQVERNVFGRVIDSKIIIPAKSGENIYLSIDMDLQLIAEKALANKRGAIIMIDVRDGSIISIVSTPTFNPNLFVDGISVNQYKELLENKDLPLFNRATKGLYPPGSTIKPMVALGGLENENISINSQIICPGYYQISENSRKFKDWNHQGHGNVDVKDAIAESCDIFFYDLAYSMGIDNLHKSLSLFGFGEKTGIDLPNEAQGILPSREWKNKNKNEPWYEGETLNTGIGQGFMIVTPIQLATATAAIANTGKLLTPKLLLYSQQQDNTIKTIDKNLSKQIAIKNIDNWDVITQGMIKTIYGKKGTARIINNNLDYTIAGKTGTAQVFGLSYDEIYIAENYDEKLRDHALFTAFAPIQNPQIAIAVIVENAGSGSSQAAPIAKKMLDMYFKKY